MKIFLFTSICLVGPIFSLYSSEPREKGMQKMSVADVEKKPVFETDTIVFKREGSIYVYRADSDIGEKDKKVGRTYKLFHGLSPDDLLGKKIEYGTLKTSWPASEPHFQEKNGKISHAWAPNTIYIWNFCFYKDKKIAFFPNCKITVFSDGTDEVIPMEISGDGASHRLLCDSIDEALTKYILEKDNAHESLIIPAFSTTANRIKNDSLESKYRFTKLTPHWILERKTDK